MAKPNSMLRAALTYAARGWRVFPLLAVTATGGCECGTADCSRPGKHPAIKGWNTEATTSKAQIEAWWGERPDRGIGIATGEESGLSVLDVDGEEGTEELGKLSAGEGMPITPTVQSRPGRFHYYFRYDPAIKSKAKKLGAHLDTRGDGGYVVAPPSQHSSGSVYTWLVPPEKAETAAWPEFLREGARKDAKKRGRPAKETFNPANPADRAKLEAALAFVDPDDEERWGQVGWILGRAFHQTDEGFALYSAWAARSRKYDAKRTRGHYYETSKQIRGGDLKTTSSLYAWATEAGWALEDERENENREFHIFENPYRESTMVAEFTAAAAAAPRVFLMDRRLIRIVAFGGSGGAGAGAGQESIDRDPETHIVLDHDPETLAVELGEIAAFWAHRENGFKRTKFSRAALTTFMACREYTGVKPLLAFVPHPTLRADGTMLDEVGYDAASRLYVTGRVEGLKVNSKLDGKGAVKAMREVMAPFDEYPWASEADRAVFAAAMFTVGLRHLFEVVPLFAFSSPKQGSGKTQLAECISRLWYNTTLSKANWTPNPEEMEKRIAAFLLAGDRIVCLDNVSEGHRLEDSTLNKVLTSRRSTFRILGKTERVELTNEATWFATGNQLSLAGDIARRALSCYVDAKMVDPASRVFKIPDLPKHVAAHRTEMMSGVLSIMASWIAAGRPVVKAPPRGYGSFTEWYAMIRPMIMWAGEADIATAINAVMEENSEEDSLSVFANALRKALPPDGSYIPLMSILKLFAANADLRPAFSGCTGPHAEPNNRTMGDLMRRLENKVFVSDNPGHNFTVKRRRTPENTWLWGCVYAEEKA